MSIVSKKTDSERKVETVKIAHASWESKAEVVLQELFNNKKTS